MESLTMRMTFFLLAIFIQSCSTQQGLSNKHDQMDIVESSSQRKSTKNIADPNRPIGPDAVFNWQKFFKGAPPTKDRLGIASSVQKSESVTSPEELILRGRNEFSLGLIARSESSFRQALRKDPKNIDAMIELAATLQRQRKIQSTFEVLANARSQLNQLEAPDEAQIFRYRYTLAMAHLANDERDKAHPILSDLVGKDRTFLPGYAALAFSYLKDDKDTVAKFIVDQAIDRGGDHPSLYNILGLLAERQGDPSIAKAHYNRALALSDAYAPALVNRANLYVISNELAMAETDYKQALEADPVNIDALIGLAAVLRRTGRHNAAKEKLLRVMDIDAENPNARFNLAILMRDNLKDEGLALRYYNEVTQSDRASQRLKEMARASIEEIRRL
jgi:tetratricopeptide (TPR) repeat protein